MIAAVSASPKNVEGINTKPVEEVDDVCDSGTRSRCDGSEETDGDLVKLE